MGRICRMGESTPTPAETGEELIRLISETAETTGLDVAQIADAIRDATGIKFNIQDGKLNITEEALRAMDWKMAYARAKCRALELPHKVIEPTPTPIRRTPTSAFIHPSERKPEPETFSLLEAIGGVPWYAWIGGFIFVLWILSHTSTGGNGPIGNRALERAEEKARSGRGAEMTNTEADAFRKKQEADSAQHAATVNAITEARQSRYSDREMEIYRFMRRRFQSYGDSYNPSIHDDLIASEAASRFGVSASEATNVYIKVDSN